MFKLLIFRLQNYNFFLIFAIFTNFVYMKNAVSELYRKNRFAGVAFYLLAIHALGILFFTVFRVILFLYNLEHARGIANGLSLFARAMLKGVQFDNLVCSYISLLPFVVLSIVVMINQINKTIIRCVTWYYVVCYAIVFGIAIADIPYFKYFLAHVKTDALGWMQFAATTTGMVFGEWSNYPFMALAAASIFGFYLLVRRWGKKLYRVAGDRTKPVHFGICLPIVLLMLALCGSGMRGTLNRYPLRNGDAFFTSYSFYNQLGINPAFSFLKSLQNLSKSKHNVNNQMSASEALSIVNKELGIANPNSDNVSPLARTIRPEGEARRANVVVILLESMAAGCLKAESNGQPLTPYLNSLIDRSIYFENFYSAGVHTNNGIVSTLYGYPALFDRPSMDANPKHYTGLPVNLAEAGYRTMFFVTSNPQYDHMNSFLHENGFERIYSEPDYPKEKVVNNFGVQDDYLLEYGLNTINKAATEPQPFLAVFMTVSKHPPFVVPEAYVGIAEKEEDCILAFVDNSVKTFMEAAAREEWYNNTYFILLGDHGAIIGKQQYGMALTFNHILLIIHSPLLTDVPRRLNCFGGQIDVFPTVMGLLNRTYTNDSFGIDLLNESRPCMFFVSNNQLGCIDSSFFYVRDLDADADFLYDLHNASSQNVAADNPDATDRLKRYSVAMTVAADTLMINRR